MIRKYLCLLALSGVALHVEHAEAEEPPASPAPPLSLEPSATPADAVSPPEGAPAPAGAAPAAPPAAEVVTPTPEALPPVAPVPSVALPAAPAAAPAPEQPRARLDYSDGSFWLRSADDNIAMTFSGRMHLDLYTFAGEGAGDYKRSNGTGLKPNLFFRRFVIETGGLIRKKWFYWMGGNFAPSTVDANQAPTSPGNVYDGFVGYMPKPNVRFYFGQYNAPFTMENVTSSRWMDMMERALTVRVLGAPHNKADGLMLWAETPHKHLEVQLGGFGGDGMNRPNVDDRFDLMSRVVVRPLASAREDALKRLHVGGSFRWGRRDSHYVRYDAPNLSTPGGYNFWSASYGKGEGETHVIPSEKQLAAGAELYVPFERWDVRGEMVYANEDRREALQSDRSKTLRGGNLSGFGSYGQLSIWLAGTPRINGNPASPYGALKLPENRGAEAKYGLQLVLRGEALRLEYDSNARWGTKGSLDAQTDKIKVNVYQAAINYWATKHVRLTAEYSGYQFPGTPTTKSMGANNQAAAPGAKAGTKPDANALYEISFRVGLAL